MWRRKTQSVSVMGMFGMEGNPHAQLFTHPLKDANKFSRGPLPDLILSGGGMVTSQLSPGLPCPLTAAQYFALAISITLPLFHLLTLLHPHCCNCRCCHGSPWDRAPHLGVSGHRQDCSQCLLPLATAGSCSWHPHTHRLM